jgi:signal transduction histidine kinase
MTTQLLTPDPSVWLAGGGEMGERIRAFDWSKTQLGPTETWSPALRMMTRFLLANRFPLLLWWGPHYVSIYNDAYRPVLGTKHPRALGQPVSECWKEIWNVLQPLIDTPFYGGPATWNDDILLEINRDGFVEETHFTIAYSPVPDETVPSGIGGVLATVHEITEKVVGERRVVALRDLGAKAAEAKTAEEACRIAAKTLAEHSKDVPFALLYLVDADGQRARLAGSVGFTTEGPSCPPVVDLDMAAEQPWPLAEVVRKQDVQVVGDLAGRFGAALPPGPWSDSPREAVVVPIRSNIANQLAGVLVAGVSARLRLDELYRSFYELIAGQIATAIANARAYEEERKRAEALAEIDRAKTQFFSNISHEFRTPLTLMLGPVEDLLDKSFTDLTPSAKGQLEVVHRNSLRLLKLVNTMLNFSRIEAGRINAHYEETDLAVYTAELASNFHSAAERVGLSLKIECPPPPAGAAPAYVDRDMWEKIVLNLLSNAFKFTLEGGIDVSLKTAGDEAELVVRDTGVGIPAEELDRIFERFHRLTDSRGRTHEGTGIGLALVRELTKLHGGSVRAESELGGGSTSARRKRHRRWKAAGRRSVTPAHSVGRRQCRYARLCGSTAVGALRGRDGSGRAVSARESAGNAGGGTPA